MTFSNIAGNYTLPDLNSSVMHTSVEIPPGDGMCAFCRYPLADEKMHPPRKKQEGT